MNAQDKEYHSPDYLLSFGVAFGKVGEDVAANLEASFSYNFFEEYERILLGVTLAGGNVDINGTKYQTNEFLAKIDYVPNSILIASLGVGKGEYELNNKIEDRTIISMSLGFRFEPSGLDHIVAPLLDQYLYFDYRLLDVGTDKMEEMVVIHFGICF